MPEERAEGTPPVDARPADDREPGYLLLRRALRNAGDHLIFERARRLISAGQPDRTVEVADAWRPLREQLPAARLSAFRAIVIAGGPGYAHGMTRTYPLGSIDDLPPVVPLALGSYVIPGTDTQLASYRFAADDRAFLDGILARTPFLGARDPVTHRLLLANGYDHALMTGDPAWYDLERIDEGVVIPRSVETIALTPPANPAYFRQAVQLFERLARARPGANVMMVHHRGIQTPFARLAARNGWENRNITGSVAGFGVYDTASLHVGYRVHAHLYATSRGIVSYLVAEDSRGVGMLEGLGGLGMPGFDARAGGREAFAMRHLPRWANAGRAGTWRLGEPAGRLLALPEIADALVGMIRSDEQQGFPAHWAARMRIRETLPVMQRMIAALP